MPPDELPTDLETLARMATVDAEPKRRNSALERLAPNIAQLARQVAAHTGEPLKGEFLAEALGYVWERLPKYRPADGRFLSWCRVVLQNRLTDLARQRGRAPIAHSAELANAAIAAQTRAALEDALDRDAPFGERDLERIRGWPCVDRLVLLTVAGLWTKVPPAEWDAWVDEHGLARPFPPPVCMACENISRRPALLAAVFGVQSNTLIQRWHRKKQCLLELDYIREFRPGV
jgi:hypothetical protein